ncbi:SH3 domain-containing protein [Flavobacteriaceae bacterium Ap0902]|nr:SH3 domain-containing protein [Flavobacteriaceae bacterium Ap0902]
MCKLLWIILAFWGTLIQAQNDEYISVYPAFTTSQQIYLFGDQVHLRSEPKSDSKSLTVLEIGSPLIILEDNNQNYSKDEPFWVHVRYNDKAGYIRSDFLSLQTVELNGVPLYTQLENNEDKTTLKIRIPTQSIPAYYEKTFEVFSTMMQLEVFGSKGLKNVRNILHINYFAEACGIDGGGKYIFIDASGHWHDAFSYVQVSDAGIFYWQETLTFPSEHKNGDYILYKSEYMETVYEGDNYGDPIQTEEHKSERVLKWNGSEITPKFKQEPMPVNGW